MNRISTIIILMLIFTFSCKKTDVPVVVVEIPQGELNLLQSYSTDVPEPSGLCFGPNKQTLLTVSDETNMVYELDLEGKIIRTLNYEGKDLEGVTYNASKNIVAVVEEADREVSLIDYSSGNFIQKYEINVHVGAENSGLEGISFNSNNNLYYIVNETNPDLMILWSPETGQISETDLDFAADYSGIFVDGAKSALWFVSDESRKLYKCDYNANVKIEYSLDALKYEGVVIDGKAVYIINDATAELNKYETNN